MNAAQAVPPPGGRRQNRAGRRPPGPRPALYLVPAPPGAAVRPSAAVPTAAVPTAAVPTAAVSTAAGPVAVRPATAGPPPASRLRLTRRGRVVATAAAALLVTVMSVIAAAAAQATNHSAPQRAASQGLVQVSVHPGQTLWSVAESADPDVDTRLIVQRIIDLNGLNGDVVQPGELLWVPRS